MWNFTILMRWHKLRNILLYFFSITEQTSCCQRKMRSPEHCLKLGRWQGPPHINNVKRNCVARVWISFVCLGREREKSVDEDLFLPSYASDTEIQRVHPRFYCQHTYIHTETHTWPNLSALGSMSPARLTASPHTGGSVWISHGPVLTGRMWQLPGKHKQATVCRRNVTARMQHG